MLNRTLVLIVVSVMCLLGVSASPAFAQSGMKFPELEKKLEPYFADELIQDIKDELAANSSYSIWGWDVGDFSGDGYYDLAISVKFHNDKSKRVQVYMFIDSEGFLTKVGHYYFDYFEMPLEIGVSIRDNSCYITKKRKLFDWEIYGYRFVNGDLIKFDYFETYRIDPFTYEKHENYQTCDTRVSYIFTKNNNKVFNANYITIPSYERGRMIYHGFANYVSSFHPDFAIEGAFYFTGDDDAAYSIKSNYDSENLYFNITIKDDEVVPTRCDSCIGDNIELWFDLYPHINGKDRLIKEIDKKKIEVRSEPDSGIYSIKISPGDFMNVMPSISSIKSTDEVSEEQKVSASKIKIISSLYEDGYKLKIKIPLEIFNEEIIPLKDEEVSIGFSLVVCDVDNEYRSEEASKISTSEFKPNSPVTFGELLLIPSTKWYGESNNIYHLPIIKTLEEYGF